jgi:hypothetical protein
MVVSDLLQCTQIICSAGRLSTCNCGIGGVQIKNRIYGISVNHTKCFKRSNSGKSVTQHITCILQNKQNIPILNSVRAC